ncbi:MAG: GNAT family N-acetyltransferase [Hyphomicrobiaceae bacterium]
MMDDGATTGLVPVIITKRLKLRGWRLEDAEPLTRLYEDPDARFLGGTGDFARAWRVMAMEVGHWVLRGYGMWAVERLDTREFAGLCGLWHPGDWKELELGWSIVPTQRGQGFATEAAKAGRNYAYRVLNATSLVSYIDPDNIRSIRVAERLNCLREEPIEISGKTCLVYRHPQPQAGQP